MLHLDMKIKVGQSIDLDSVSVQDDLLAVEEDLLGRSMSLTREALYSFYLVEAAKRVASRGAILKVAKAIFLK